MTLNKYFINFYFSIYKIKVIQDVVKFKIDYF